LLGINKLVNEFEGNTDELSIDMRNFIEEIEVMDSDKPVQIPG